MDFLVVVNMKTVITNIEYKAGVLNISSETHPIGNELTFKEVHDLIIEYGAVNKIIFEDNDTDLNQIYMVALTIKSFLPNLILRLVSDKANLNDLSMTNILYPIPFTTLLMDGVLYKVVNDKLVKHERI